MKRHDFLKEMGIKGAALMAVYCGASSLSSCENDTAGVAPKGDIVLDLNASANAALKTNGGYIVLKDRDIVVAKTNLGTYVAVTLICSHEQQKQITYKTSEFYCTAHGARYDNAGKGLNTEGKKGLTVYATSISGSTLTIKA
jgi:cytochrome b6-f complex iron-sulfur subunit